MTPNLAEMCRGTSTSVVTSHMSTLNGVLHTMTYASTERTVRNKTGAALTHSSNLSELEVVAAIRLGVRPCNFHDAADASNIPNWLAHCGVGRNSAKSCPCRWIRAHCHFGKRSSAWFCLVFLGCISYN